MSRMPESTTHNGEPWLRVEWEKLGFVKGFEPDVSLAAICYWLQAHEEHPGAKNTVNRIKELEKIKENAYTDFKPKTILGISKVIPSLFMTGMMERPKSGPMICTKLEQLATSKDALVSMLRFRKYVENGRRLFHAQYHAIVKDKNELIVFLPGRGETVWNSGLVRDLLDSLQYNLEAGYRLVESTMLPLMNMPAAGASLAGASGGVPNDPASAADDRSDPGFGAVATTSDGSQLNALSMESRKRTLGARDN